MKCNGGRIAKTILKKSEEFRRFVLLNFKSYYRATVIKTAGYWHKDTLTDKWNRIKNPKINPYIYG